MELNYTQKIKELIDNLKARCNSAGLGGDGNEYKVITQSFLYKFLNDKFLHDVVKTKPELADNPNITEALESMSENDYNLMLARLGGGSAKLKPEHLIATLFNRQNDEQYKNNFYKLFNDTLHDIAVQNAGTFSVHTDEGTDVLLFDNELFNSVSDSSKRNSLARAVINLLANEKLDFSMAFDQGFDFFSTIFEYMIKDYNANGGGVYAEYYTPRSVARIMADILVGDEKPSDVKILDPSAGSGTLLMSIAHKIGAEDCSIYSQDISQKSSNLLRLNLILNNLAHSISHVIEGNTITKPAHMDIIKDKGFDYIVSNPPFNLDFSAYRDEIANSEANAERFFAGVPKIPASSDGKKKMAIYLLFVQHIIYSLSDNGKAAIVVPDIFTTSQSGIAKDIKKKIIDNGWLMGAISMPPNIFAKTGTNVAVLFIDKKNTKAPVLVDATKLGKKIKEDNKHQRTLLSVEDERQIVNAFAGNPNLSDFSIQVENDEIAEKGYSFSAGRYFGVEIGMIKATTESVRQKIDNAKQKREDLESGLANLRKEIYDSESRIEINEPDMTYSPKMKCKVPSDWQVVKMEKLISSIKTGLNPRQHFKLNNNGDISYITVKNLTKDGVINFEKCDKVDEDAKHIIHRRSDIKIGDILFASIAPLGRCYLITKEPTDWDINESVFSIRANTDMITPEYLYLILTDNHFVDRAEKASAGSIFKGIRIDTLLGMYVVIPPKATIEKITALIKPILKKREAESTIMQADRANEDLLFSLITNGQAKL